MIVSFIILFVYGSTIDLKTALESALEYSPHLKSLKEEMRSFDGKALIYRWYINPSVGVEFGNFGTSKESFGKSPFYRLSYLQPILLYPIGKLSKGVVENEKQAFRLFLEKEKNILLGEVYRTFYEALYKKELLKIAETNLKISDEIYRFVKKLYEFGETTRIELSKAETEQKLAKTEIEIAKAEYKNTLKKLYSLVGKEVEDVEGKLEDIKEIGEIKPEELPHVRLYDYTIESIKRSIELEKLFAKPQLSIEVLTEKVAEIEYGIRFGITTTLPLFYRKEGEILQLMSSANALSYQKEKEIINIKSEYENLMKRYIIIKEEFQRIEDEILPRAKQNLSLAIKSYQLRIITFLELSDTERRYMELLKYRAGILMKAHEEFAKYLTLGGKL